MLKTTLNVKSSTDNYKTTPPPTAIDRGMYPMRVSDIKTT